MSEILIVEDMKVQAQLLEYHLGALGHQFRTVVNGREALEILKEYKPDLIISDVEMPEMNGLQLCAAVKKNPDLLSIPLILLTAADSPLDVLRGIEVMADGYLTKPYEEPILKATICSVTNRGASSPQQKVDEPPINFDYEGETHTISASRDQMLRLFLTAYENSMAQNALLIEKEEHLTNLNSQLSRTIEQLSASEERFRGLVQTMPDIVYKIDQNGTFTFVNDAIHRLGYHQSELIGRHFSEIIYEDDINKISANSVLPELAGTDADQVTPPKLFDERRKSDRMTIGLQIRLKTKSGNLGATVEVRAIGEQVINVEVNSLGMYGEAYGIERQYVGTVGVIRDISDRIQAQEAMRMAKDTANAANQAKSEFLSSMSHELRTPLNAILGFGQLLDDPRNPLNVDQLTGLQHIMQGGEHLLDLINEVLDLAKIESGNVSISIEQVETVKAVSQCILMAVTLADKFNITVENKVTGNEVPWIHADLTRFKQVLINLLSNAVKYNISGGKVTLDWALIDGMVRFVVTDTGPGIPKAKQDLLFQPFQRLGKETSAIEGTGIGLNICRELMQQMKGSIGFSSEEGAGSRFWVDFPLSTAVNEDAVIAQSKNKVEELVKKMDVSFDTEKTVLYVEDNPANMQLMTRIFRDLPDCRLITASDAEAGLEMAIAQKPDLILMDINLPGMNGLQALAILLETKETHNIPVVAVTAAAMDHDREAGKQAGFTEYLTKPFNIPKIMRTVVRVLREHAN